MFPVWVRGCYHHLNLLELFVDAAHLFLGLPPVVLRLVDLSRRRLQFIVLALHDGVRFVVEYAVVLVHQVVRLQRVGHVVQLFELFFPLLCGR